jgi:hypothetical protein
MKTKSRSLGASTIPGYIQKLGPSLGAVARILKKEIESLLPQAGSKLYHGMPVWFIGENAVVGIGLTSKKTIKLLFWNGQAFDEPKLIPIGSFEAVQIEFKEVSDIPLPALRRWIKKSGKKIWDFASLRRGI